MIHSEMEKRIYFLYADNQKEMKEWVTIIEKEIEKASFA